LKIAVIFKQIDQVMREPLEISTNNLMLNIATLNQMVKNPLNICNEEVINGLVKDNMAAYFTGDLDISSINKLVGLVLIQKGKVNFNLQQFARVLLSLETYHYIRAQQVENKHQKLIEIFDTKMTHERRTMSASPGEPEPEELKPFYDEYDGNDIIENTKDLLPNYTQVFNFCKFLHGYYAGNDINIEKCRDLGFSEVFGIDYQPELFLAANVVQALNFPELKYRVDTVNRVVLTPEIDNYDNVTDYLKSVVRAEYINDYNAQLDRKKQIEKERETIIQINHLIDDTELDEFIKHLNEYIGQRDSPKYTQLVDEMLKKSHNEISYLREKIWIMALCRKPYEEDIVFSRGNVCSKLELINFKKMWDLDETGEIGWTEFEKAQHNLSWYSSHNYRDGMANRHGHANVCPSSLRGLEVVPKGYWSAAAYNASHRNSPIGPEDV
jgi:hypothetical protein